MDLNEIDGGKNLQALEVDKAQDGKKKWSKRLSKFFANKEIVGDAATCNELLFIPTSPHKSVTTNGVPKSPMVLHNGDDMPMSSSASDELEKQHDLFNQRHKQFLEMRDGTYSPEEKKLLNQSMTANGALDFNGNGPIDQMRDVDGKYKDSVDLQNGYIRRYVRSPMLLRKTTPVKRLIVKQAPVVAPPAVNMDRKIFEDMNETIVELNLTLTPLPVPKFVKYRHGETREPPAMLFPENIIVECFVCHNLSAPDDMVKYEENNFVCNKCADEVEVDCTHL